METAQFSMAMYPVNEQGGSVGKSMGCGGGIILTEEELANIEQIPPEVLAS